MTHSDRETKKPPPNYASRSVQYRLLVLVGMLMAVILLMVEAAKPKNWEWMWSFQQKTVANAVEDNYANNKPIDPRPQPASSSNSHPADSFVSETVSTEPIRAEVDITLDDLDRSMLGTIQDDTYFRADERDAWFLLLSLLQSTSQEDLVAKSHGSTSFAQLFRQTEELRGSIVTVQGTVRRATKVKAQQNHLGITDYWQCWVRPHDGSNSPVVVYALELPEGLTTGNDIREPASFSGFCFKRWSFNSASGPMIAPVVLAKTAEWEPEPVLERKTVPNSQRILSVVVAAIIAIAIAFFTWLASRWKTHRFVEVERESVEDFATIIEGVDIPTVSDKLRDLESAQTDIQ